ncbi:CubicO group peptidase (beta-lactamase class C family) [Actinophytocola oryzae]|uniref:CubicO group peptidase (Beta-lactamase class C family) n=2 Tax=Actinophytocola oryzae TaxID=502181 RepID=A0A4R7V3P8_9PSEU|nr:CubicO group peptidase (beta-lactamase class C family) [Actinophytocola oryzae]
MFGAAAGLLGTAGAATGEPSPGDLGPGGRFERFVAARAAADQFSGTVLLARHGRPVLTRSYGLANRDGNVPIRPETRIDLASITKSLTAVAVTQLVERGAVACHAPLGTYLDGYPADVAGATVHQLLTHTAGVGRPGLTNQRPPGEDAWDSVEEVWQGMSAYLRTLPLRFPPGTRFDYSNDGYFVLGEIVAAVSGQTYHDYVRRHVFARAGMSTSDFFTRPRIRADAGIARAYATQPDGSRADATSSPYFPYVGGPFTGAFCSAGDLLRFATALHGGRLLDLAYTAVATSGKQATGPQPPQFYGYGQVETIIGTHRVVGHTGSGAGRANNLDVFPDAGWVAVVLSNYDTTVRPIVDLARELVTGVRTATG